MSTATTALQSILAQCELWQANEPDCEMSGGDFLDLIEQEARAALKHHAPKAWGSHRCRECKGTDVQHAVWLDLNTNESGEEFGSWCAGDNSWCVTCQDHTYLEEVEA